MSSAEAACERSRLVIILLTIVSNISAVIFFAHVPWSDWRTGMYLNLFDNFMLIAYAILRRDQLMARLMVFGLALGFTELAADAWLVDWTRTLDYSIGGGPMIWRSPLWMPFAWEVVAVQFGYLGMRLMEGWGKRGLFLAGLIGAVNIPFYEEMALRTQWWAYDHCRMLLHTPYYIILGEFFIVLGIAVLAKNIRRASWLNTFISGTVGGIVIFMAYAGAYVLIEKIF